MNKKLCPSWPILNSKSKKNLHILHWVKNRNLTVSGPDMIQYRDLTQISENIFLRWQETYWYYNFLSMKNEVSNRTLVTRIVDNHLRPQTICPLNLTKIIWWIGSISMTPTAFGSLNAHLPSFAIHFVVVQIWYITSLNNTSYLCMSQLLLRRSKLR